MQKEEDIQVLLNKGRQRPKLMCFVNREEDGRWDRIHFMYSLAVHGNKKNCYLICNEKPLINSKKERM